MKNIIILSVLLISGCATSKPAWQQSLENLHRQWRPAAYTIIEDRATARRPNNNILSINKHCSIH